MTSSNNNSNKERLAAMSDSQGEAMNPIEQQGNLWNVLCATSPLGPPLPRQPSSSFVTMTSNKNNNNNNDRLTGVSDSQNNFYRSYVQQGNYWLEPSALTGHHTRRNMDTSRSLIPPPLPHQPYRHPSSYFRGFPPSFNGARGGFVSSPELTSGARPQPTAPLAASNCINRAYGPPFAPPRLGFPAAVSSSQSLTRSQRECVEGNLIDAMTGLLLSTSKDPNEIGNAIKEKLISFAQTYLRTKATHSQRKTLAKHFYQSVLLAQEQQEAQPDQSLVSKEMKLRLNMASHFVSEAGLVSVTAKNEKRLKLSDMTSSHVNKFFAYFGISILPG